MRRTFSHTVFIGKNVFYYPECTSTNLIAQDLLANKSAREGDLIITNYQTAGRGQRGNSWQSERNKNLTFSVVLMPEFMHSAAQFSLNIVVSLALKDFFLDYYPQGFSIKWPNDLYFENQKIAGILIESNIKNTVLQSVVVGMGININQENFSNLQATSLRNICNQPFELDDLLKNLLEHLEHRYFQLKKDQIATLKTEYARQLYWFGTEHVFRDQREFTGIITGITEWGQLLIESKTGIKSYNFKEVAFVR